MACPSPKPFPRTPRTVVYFSGDFSSSKRPDIRPWPALILASADVDLHAAVKLLKQGCSPETALSILT